MPLFGNIQIKSIGILKNKNKTATTTKNNNKKRERKPKTQKKRHFIFGQAGNISLFDKLI